MSNSYTSRERDITIQEKKWAREKQLLAREAELKQDKRSFYFNYHKKLTTSKKLIAFLFGNCMLIEFVAIWVTLKSVRLAELTGGQPDFGPLLALIGAIIGEVIGYAVYALKSIKENTKDGIVYDLAMKESEKEDNANG